MASEGAAKRKLKLYSYFFSSCAFRVRFALNFKRLDYEYIAADLAKGEQFSPEFLKLNPAGYVPALEDNGIVISDSLAISLYLEVKYPEHPLLPRNLQRRAINYQAANIVCSSIQPIQNGGLRYNREKISPEERILWVKDYIRKGFVALEKLLENYAGIYATGDEVHLADIFLAPQIDSAIKRFNFDMNEYPLLSRLNDAYMVLPAFQNAMPENQPDTPVESIEDPLRS